MEYHRHHKKESCKRKDSQKTWGKGSEKVTELGKQDDAMNHEERIFSKVMKVESRVQEIRWEWAEKKHQQ